MNMSTPIATSPPLFKSLTALRMAHTNLLKEYQNYDEDNESRLPEQFIKEVELFLHRAGSSGVLLDIEEDRSDAQALLNYWTTVLYNAGQTPRPTLVANFEEQVASQQVGERCPYRGLQAFHQEDRSFFYGRRQLARDMMKWLQKENFLAVVGLSGSGKSSVVRAGLIPELQEGALPGSESWVYHDTIVPGPEPLRSLAELARPADVTAEQWHRQHAKVFLHDDAHLHRLMSSGGKTAVVVVDQFEELFTLSQNDEERRAFVANLVRLTKSPNRRHIVIITMRSEFDTYVARFPELQELFERAQIRVPPLNPLDLRKAIEKPAERSGLSFEAGLVEELVQQVLGEPAGLPLLQFTLYKLWENRKGKDITWDIYRELGGSPREILAGVADATYESFKFEEDRNISRRIMLRLVRPGAGLDVTSNRVRRASLPAIGPRDNVNRVLDVWVAAGLLRVTPAAKSEDDQVEVMHEALIRNWPELVVWVEKERVNLRQRLQLTSDAQRWAEHRRDPGGLLGGTLLAEALGFEDLNELEREFVAASRLAADEAEEEKELHQQRVNSLRRLQLIFGSIFLVVALGLLAWALWQTKKAFAASNNAQGAIGKLREEQVKTDLAKTEAQRAEKRIEETQKDAEAKALVAAAAADKKLSDLKGKTEEELVKLEEYKTQVTTAQKRVRDIEAETQAKLEAKDRINENLEASLKTVAASLAAARPAILIANGRFNTPPGEWMSKLEPHRAQIEKTIVSVGRLEPNAVDLITAQRELKRTSDLVESGVASRSDYDAARDRVEQARAALFEPTTFVGTAFLIAPDVAIIPSYVARSLPKGSKGFLIDFREKPDANNSEKFPASIIGEVVVESRDISQKDLTLLRVEKRSASGLHLPPPLILAKSPNLQPGRTLYVVGYPLRDLRNPSEILDALLGNIDGVKRLQPGYFLELVTAQMMFDYDSFTMSGNAGSPVVDLETGKVIGLTYRGTPASVEGLGIRQAVPLWMLADNPVLVKAGVIFQ